MDVVSLLKELLNRIKKTYYGDCNDSKDSIISELEMYIRQFGLDSEYQSELNKLIFSPMVYPASEESRISSWERGKRGLMRILETMIKQYSMFPIKSIESQGEKSVSGKDIFIVHGHDEGFRLEVSNYLYQIGLNPIVLQDQPNGGCTTVIDKLTQYSDVSCAIVLMTGDDIGRVRTSDETENKLRARQNVVLETGMFIGKCGIKRVVLLCDDGIEIPSDLNGCLYIARSNSEGWRSKLNRELRSMGLKVN